MCSSSIYDCTHVHFSVPTEAKTCTRFLGTEVTDRWVHHVGVQNWTCILWKDLNSWTISLCPVKAFPPLTDSFLVSWSLSPLFFCLNTVFYTQYPGTACNREHVLFFWVWVTLLDIFFSFTHFRTNYIIRFFIVYVTF